MAKKKKAKLSTMYGAIPVRVDHKLFMNSDCLNEKIAKLLSFEFATLAACDELVKSPETVLGYSVTRMRVIDTSHYLKTLDEYFALHLEEFYLYFYHWFYNFPVFTSREGLDKKMCAVVGVQLVRACYDYDVREYAHKSYYLFMNLLTVLGVKHRYSYDDGVFLYEVDGEIATYDIRIEGE